MKQKFSTNGALRARTRALCALTLALFTSATAFAGLDGDAIAGNSISRAESYLPAATPSEELVGGVYHYTVDINSWQQLYMDGALDSEHSGETYKCHIEYFLSEQIPVGQWIQLTTVNTTRNANTILQSTGEGTGTWFKRQESAVTSGNWYITNCMTGSRIYGLFVLHVADNEWFYCVQLLNSNGVQVAINIGEVPVYDVAFDVNNTTMGTIRSAASLPDIRTGIKFDVKCSGRAKNNSGYKFGIWSDGSTAQTHNFPTYCDASYTAYFVPDAAVSRTVTVNNGTDGTGAVLWSDETEGPVIAQSSGSFFAGVPINLVVTQTGSNPFHHWEDENGATVVPESTSTNGSVTTCVVIVPDKNTTYTPVFAAAPATPTYEVAATVSPAGAGSVTGTGTFDAGDDVSLTATPTNRRYRFLRWTESASTVGTSASYSIDDIDADHALVAVFEEIPVTIADNENSSYYASTLSTFSTETDFQLMRTFYAGMWNTVCFPFDLTAAQRTNSDMSGATFYTLTSVTGDASTGLDFNVTAVTTETMTARTPYLVQFTGSDIVNPVFEDVTLAASAFTNNTSGTNVGDTKFFGTVHPTALEIGQSSGFLFLGQNNNLYWPNVNNDIRAFRAYFYSGSSEVQSVHPRARIVVRGETPTDVEERIADGNASAPRKYLHNGVLVIEKNGIRYNAVGEPLSE